MPRISLTVNGRPVSADIDERTLLLEFIRYTAGFTGTKNGCLEARCGCCNVLVDGALVKSCNALALQFDGSDVTTVEGLAEEPDGSPPSLNTLQAAFHEHGALQCGFCTPGMLMTLSDFLNRCTDPTEEDVRRALAGSLCRCTGYQKIIDATLDAAKTLQRA
jgi:carbon-monoxide dehydrogenase small subunit